MEIKVWDYENEDKGILVQFKLRRNSKKIIENIEKELEKKYNCSIRRVMATGKIDMATGRQDIHYVLFGDNLPCRIIKYYAFM